MNKLYKKIFAFVITTVMLVSGAAVLAASPEPTTRPRPESGQTTQTTEKKSEKSTEKTTEKSSGDKTGSDKDNSDTDDNVKESASDNGNESKGSVSITVETDAPKTAAAVSEKHYTTRGGAFGWFILSILVNAVLSFAIGNRFYKMSKKNSHISAEVRALRRDIEEKFNSNIGGFSERDVEVSNSNESYAPDEGEIRANVKKTEEEISAEETFKEWEENLAKQEAERREALREALKPRSTREFVEEDDASFDSHRGEKSYKPMREPQEEAYDDEEEESTFEVIKNKAKEIITDIFPFRED